MVRWWWFGPSATNQDIDRDIEQIRKAGFGGVEVQAVYPQIPDGGLPGLRNYSYLSPTFLDALGHAGRKARAEGLRIDVTGGSGWPFGGPHIGVDQAAAEIRMAKIAVPSGQTAVRLPALGPGEKIVAVKIGGSAKTQMERIADFDATSGSVLQLPSVEAGREVLVFVAGRTGQQVKRPAVGAEGYVLDHMSKEAVSQHLKVAIQPLLTAFQDQLPPDAIFSDSLEAYGSSWTDDLPEEFRRRRGYDLLDHVEVLFTDAPKGVDVRFDWARTLAELVDERYLSAIQSWASANGTRFRAQVYGIPPVSLSSASRVALPEGEGEDWRSFTSTRWATSGAHLYDKPVVSSEVWTWLHSPSWAATPLDLKMEADRHFLQGVNQLVGHGWPLSPNEAGNPGWSLYAAAALNQHNPWSISMPDVTRYLQRLSHLLRQGSPDNSVAIYLPIEDSYADMRPAHASANDAMPKHVSAALVGAVLDAGYGFDFVDAEAVSSKRMKHKLLILPPISRIDPNAYAAISRWVEDGGKLVVIGDLPQSAGGLQEGKARGSVLALSRKLARQHAFSKIGIEALGTQLPLLAPRDLHLAKSDSSVGFIRRATSEGSFVLIVNSSNQPVSNAVILRDGQTGAQWWDPMTASRWSAGTGSIPIALAPYESRVLFLPKTLEQLPPASALVRSTVLRSDWSLEFDGRGRKPAAPGSWTDTPALQHYSGVGSYRFMIDADVRPNRCFSLDFGETIPRAAVKEARHLAAVDAPVREAARVKVNGQNVGSVWAPPYRIDVSKALKTGPNEIEVEVGNSALNNLSGQTQPDRRLLNLRYGERFAPQDTELIVPQPSGLMKPVQLVEGTAGGGVCGAEIAGTPSAGHP
ncbi:alpha-L-rhamnosidase [Sphingobium sp. AP50]|nr:alpha-L-rhamnosidase [Sphingobium sp. AP50]